MKKILFVGMLGALLVPGFAMADSAFDGTWKIDMSKVHMPKKAEVHVLQNGMYACKTCVPAYTVKADGSDQPVTGHPYFDTVAIQASDDHTVQETEKKAGKVVGTSTITVAPDGKTATVVFSDSSATNADPVTGKLLLTRVAAGPSGSHAASGAWQQSDMQTMSDNGLTMTYKVDGHNLNMSTPTGQSYSAKMDGTDSPYNGDPGTTSVSVKSLSKNSVQETDKRNGKIISVSKMSIEPDGKTMDIQVADRLRGTSMSLVAIKE
jgi:hypothetical protein